MALIHGNPDNIATLLRDGIAHTLEQNIKAKLMEVVDPIMSELARDLARKTSVHVESYMAYDVKDAFGPKIIVNLAFNNEQVKYEAERTGERVNTCGGIGSAQHGTNSAGPGGPISGDLTCSGPR